jgi:hypothetical protein
MINSLQLSKGGVSVKIEGKLANALLLVVVILLVAISLGTLAKS